MAQVDCIISSCQGSEEGFIGLFVTPDIKNEKVAAAFIQEPMDLGLEQFPTLPKDEIAVVRQARIKSGILLVHIAHLKSTIGYHFSRRI